MLVFSKVQTIFKLWYIFSSKEIIFFKAMKVFLQFKPKMLIVPGIISNYASLSN